jgi:hypothetical protein
MLFNAGMMLLAALFVFRMARLERAEPEDPGTVSASSDLP